MGANATSLAILDAHGRVVTFVRPDVPAGWQPPDGCTAVPDDELPEGWERAPDNSPVPQSISARQIRLWLVRNGVSLATVEAAINAIPDAVTRESVRVEWEYAPYVERTHAWLVPMAAALGMNESQVDAAFREAAAL
jgi:hypothetical protein